MKIIAIPISPYEARHHARLQQIAKDHNATIEYDDQITMGNPGIFKKVQGADILIVTPRLPGDILPYLEGCRLIALESTGHDIIDLERSAEMGITVCNVPDYSSSDVAERIFALILGLAHHIQEGHQTVIQGAWVTPTSQIATALNGKNIGLFGFGKIGQKVAKIAHAFNMNVIAHTKNPDPARAEKHNIQWVDFSTLLKTADIVALAAPATPENHQQFNAAAFAQMKPTALFINTARGALVDETALAEALLNGEIAGAGVDVFQVEPLPENHPLKTAPNTLLSPHTAFASNRSLDQLHNITLDNVEAFLKGAPQNVVTPHEAGS